MSELIPDGFPAPVASGGTSGARRAGRTGRTRGRGRRREWPWGKRKGRSTPPTPLSIAAEAAVRIRSEIARAGGREVCFLAEVDEQRVIRRPRAVARGNFEAVLVAAKDAPQGGVMLHNHPSGSLEPSEADMRVAAQIYEDGLGTAIVDNDARELYVVVEPPAPRVRVPIDVDELGAVLAPGGALARPLRGLRGPTRAA